MRTPVVTLICDMPDADEENVRTQQFSVDGADYEMELCAADRRAFDEMAHFWVSHARKRAERRAAPGRRTQADRRRSAAIRAWAVSTGRMRSDRGRIPENVIADYDAAH